jgi:transposase
MKQSTDMMADWETDARVIVALDLSDKESRWMAKDLNSGERREGTVAMTRPAVREWMEGAPKGCRVVLEAGTHGAWVTALLRKLGHRAVILHSDVLVRGGRRRKKSDTTDCEGLLDIAWDIEMGKRVETVWMRSEEHQADLAVVRTRDGAVRLRTQAVTIVRGMVKQFGERIGKHEVEAMPRFAREELSAPVVELVEPLLTTIEHLTTQVAEFDKRLAAQLKRRHPECKEMLKVDGPGVVNITGVMALVGEPTRFAKSRTVGAYVGLGLRLAQSGEYNPQLGIAKTGCKLIRRNLIQASHRIIGPHGKDSDLRRFGLRLMGDGTNRARKKRAVVAVARKLVVLLHALWVSGEEYDPLRNTKKREAAERAAAERAAAKQAATPA